MMSAGVGRFGCSTVGSWLTYELGSESKSLPGYVVLTAGRGTSGGASLWSSGSRPSAYADVLFRNQGDSVLNLAKSPGISQQMQSHGLVTLRRLNSSQLDERKDHKIASRISAYHELAFRMQSSAPELIDISDESQQTINVYSVERTEPKNWNVSCSTYGASHTTFAKNCLLARRMVERGVRFVNIFHASWNQHNNLNNELCLNCSVVDQPIAALLKDLKNQSLLDSILVVMAGEFGRTPLGENRAGSSKVTGRDHHSFAFSLWMAGSGVKGGQVIGATDKLGWSPVEEPVHINDFHATMLHLFGFDHTKLAVSFGGLNVRLTNVGGKVVNKIIA